MDSIEKASVNLDIASIPFNLFILLDGKEKK